MKRYGKVRPEYGKSSGKLSSKGLSGKTISDMTFSEDLCDFPSTVKRRRRWTKKS